MNIDFSEEQELLIKSARDFLAAEYPKTMVREMVEDERGYTPELWRKITDLGWLGLACPEKYGGTGGSFMDLVLLLEEMGRACFTQTFFSAVVLGQLTILDCGSEEMKLELLPDIVQGKLILTLASTEADASYNAASIGTKATKDGNDYGINGVKLFVPDAGVADYIICIARTKEGTTTNDGITLFLMDATSPGITITPLKTIGGDKQHEVILRNVKVPQEKMLGELDKGWDVIERTLARAVVAKCAEMCGGAQQVLEMTVDYSKQRVQFGHPIGSFQAIQHHCANMAIDVEGARLITYEAAWKLSEGLPCTLEVAMAKTWVSEAYRRVTALGHQVHGGIGFMEVHDMPLYFKRAKAAELAFGDADFHRDKIASILEL